MNVPAGPVAPYGMYWAGLWDWTSPTHADRLKEIAEVGAHWTPEHIEAWKWIPHGRIRDAYPEGCDPFHQTGMILLDKRNTAVHRTGMGIPADHDPSQAPVLECTCGYYSFKALDDAKEYGHGKLGCTIPDCDCRAGVWKVELSGLVIEHEHGYRAKHLRLVEETT